MINTMVSAANAQRTELRPGRTSAFAASAVQDLNPLDSIAGPSDAELWAIEAEAELLAAELALVDAEAAWYRRPDPNTAAEYLAAVGEVLDLHSLYGYETTATASMAHDFFSEAA